MITGPLSKTIYYLTKLAPELSNVARILATHLSNLGKEFWKALERCVCYLSAHDNQGIIFDVLEDYS
jgi:hypothetical protein